MIRWHRIKHRVAADAWFNRPGTGKIVVVDCGKGLPPQIDSLVDIVTEDDDGGRQETWRVRGIERSRNCTKVGLIVTKATEEEKAEAYGAVSPAWKAGSTGIPSDRDVWAYIHNHGTRDIELLRGRDDQGDFMPPGEDWTDLHTGSVVCWLDAEEQPSFGVATVRAGIEALRAVAAHHPDAHGIAAAALESRTVKFTRYYS
ncbi:hypothetical protein [Methylobacterium sp. SI9]|uniref:hypothetical protein n=1 Tax=Methylobacterium guangdongense TaxID=3138811 RepID=UPI00313ED652